MSCPDTITALRPGLDLRRPEYRRETFLRFYGFHLRYRSHPGCVYYLLPSLRHAYAMTDDEAAWFAFLNGNTQNPIVSLYLWRPTRTAEYASDAVALWRARYDSLGWDTDRRHHKAHFPQAVASYVAATSAAGGEARWWRRPQSWPGLWQQASGLYSFGRLSTWSYLEYGRIMGLHDHDADDLLVSDIDGSRSHRNGLAIVDGLDGFDWHASNPGFDGHYPPDLLEHLDLVGEGLLSEAKRRFPGRDTTRLTLESALCTYKSWHRPNRRYPNVYNDMLYDRIKAGERAGLGNLDLLWKARRDALPPYLRLEASPLDPGCVPVKQNWYRTTGEVVMMDRDDPALTSGFAARMAAGQYLKLRRAA